MSATTKPWTTRQKPKRAKPTEPMTQLATVIPKTLHVELRLHAIQRDAYLGDLITRYLRQGLARDGA